MNYFKKFTSNTYAGSGNQLHFSTNGEIKTGRIFYKISVGGRFRYSLLFSNIIDSTYADGTQSHANLICDSWHIFEMQISRCKDFEPSNFTSLTFDGQTEKDVMPGEFYCSDPVEMEFMKDEYLCLEVTYSGNMIPYHEEAIIPSFVKENDEWIESKYVPFASMVGCDRKVKGKIAYLGDSITQGIGTEMNSYKHWNAILSEKLGDNYSYWNLGIGCGRANDGASDGAWLYKAKQNDIVFVCFGVNDILQGQSETQIKTDLTRIIDILNETGIKVILQTIPPFDYKGDDITKWNNINLYIKNELSNKAYMFFDNTPYLGKKNEPHIAVYGGHPNDVLTPSESDCQQSQSVKYETGGRGNEKLEVK